MVSLSDQSNRPTKPFDAAQARYFDKVQEALKFTPDELSLLAKNGFVVTDRLAFEQFKRAYAYIYWKDLPVLITTDSILHAIHHHYDGLLQAMEGDIVSPLLFRALYETRLELQKQALSNNDEQLTSIYEDLDVYLSIAFEVFRNRFLPSEAYPSDYKPPQIPPRAQPFVDALRWLNLNDWRRESALRDQAEKREKPPFLHSDPVPSNQVLEDFGLNDGDGKIISLYLFGTEQLVDISQLKARGHYVEEEFGPLKHYFMAMMWLALVNFPLMSYDLMGKPVLNRSAMAAAHLLRDALEHAKQRRNIEIVDHLLNAFVGWSDNITLNGLDNFIEDTGAGGALDYFAMDDATLLNLLINKDYGQQRITGSPLMESLDKTSSTPRPASFSLMGQRFTLESWIMGELVYDRLTVNGEKVQRSYPSSLDVMAALGNDRAIAHLSDELAKYGYGSRLQELRSQVEIHSNEFWESTFYNRWLRVICTLNDLSGAQVSGSLRSTAWGDKMLHTQLAAWTQLRHDNVLFVKQPYEMAAICDYPAGYVEPYPAFYATVKDYADFGLQVFGGFSQDGLQEKMTQIISLAKGFFGRLSAAAAQLQSLAQKELVREPFTEDEELFLRSVVVRKYVGQPGYGGYSEETWGGWYSELVGWDQSPAVVADIYTSLNKRGVLQIGTGAPVVEVVAIETDKGSTIYVGPAFTYFEFRLIGYPFKRLDSGGWRRLIASSGTRLGNPETTEPALIAPNWVTSFRHTCDSKPEPLKLPGWSKDQDNQPDYTTDSE